MLYSFDVRRLARRILAPICALVATMVIAFISLGAGPGARAQGLPPAPSAVIAAAPAREMAGSRDAPTEEAPRSARTARTAAREARQTASGTSVLVYPPMTTGEEPAPAAPIVMMLHGMCGDPASTCDFWSRAGREGSFLLCPEGNVACGGARDWAGSGEQKAAALDESIAAVDRAYGPLIAHEKGDVLIGFSRGAFVARDVAYARPGRFRGLILIGAWMRPDAGRLKASGIRRVVMAAGEYDGARPAMQRAASAMSAAGLPSRYVSLGRIGHQLPDDLEAILRDSLRWVREPG